MKTIDLKIVFFGTSEFAVASLEALLRNNYNIAGVVTVPDKPAGRGQKLHFSPVKSFAIENNLFLLQPINLKAEEFIQSLKKINADLQIIIAFRMLPEAVWKMPRLGTFNLHASLLPQYRGAAPINWAIINGEAETGLTTFFLDDKIDTGKIIYTEKISIGEDETAGELHDILKTAGASLVIKTVKSIEENNVPAIEQTAFIGENTQLQKAPKILKEHCRIDWNKPVKDIHNFIRGLCPIPAAFTELVSPDGKIYYLKIFSSRKEIKTLEVASGKVYTDGRTYFSISGNDGFIHINELQLQGKKRLGVTEFLKGFKLDNSWNTL